MGQFDGCARAVPASCSPPTAFGTSSQGKRVAFDGLLRTVIDGPFAETRELVAGFWLWEVKDMDEAVAWVKHLPQSYARTERDRNPTAI